MNGAVDSISLSRHLNALVSTAHSQTPWHHMHISCYWLSFPYPLTLCSHENSHKYININKRKPEQKDRGEQEIVKCDSMILHQTLRSRNIQIIKSHVLHVIVCLPFTLKK
ncbi:hypothetical protein VIGAN_10244800 [Vigna angularis var. angularis]|uniref:Uncharacterized protein n=1 Tax=Vigna angularis var. angularis TaxID=157739 RepID=A0A0S3T7E4_PHAAN|nr:hypothetical protein VIGAN_10244800 [Vigna angularis var. angularis]